ncbi:MAG: M56 family metallopeptidase, partial [Bacteroidales bacterium]|nr:M56 family metallopeptidase [Bacteroidales bacterium]
MMEFLVYDAKVAVALLVFYLFYRFLLKKETFHRFNRVVLVGTAVLSFLLPLCIITIHKPIEVAPMVPESPALATDLPAQELVPLVEHAVPWWPIALIILFWAGVAFVLARVTTSILSIVRIIHRGQLVKEEDGCQIIVTERDIDPFSWMKYIVLSRKDWEAPHESILAHEKAHICQGHSMEVLLVDVLSALQWFNPAIWMLRADLQELHEYEADDAVLRAGTNIKEYQYLLIRKAVSKSGYSVANSFNHSILKNRITMMSKSKSPLSRGWRVLYLLPLVCLGLGLQARTVYVPIDKDSEKIVFNETGALSGSVWTGEVGKLTFFDTTFEIRTEDEIIRGNYAVDNSTI